MTVSRARLDATALARTAAAVVFVIGARMTNAREARAALEQLDPSGTKIIGAVLSRADADRHSPYYSPKFHKYYTH